MKIVFCVAALAVVAGCAGTPSDVKKDSVQINFPHYSLVLPSDQGWRVQMQESRESVRATLQSSGPARAASEMQYYAAQLGQAVSLSAQAIADDFRSREKAMVEQGVKKGEYRLSDVAMGEELVGQKKFYTMKYRTFTSSGQRSAAMYLYFPRKEAITYFLIAHYSEATFSAAEKVSSKEEAVSTNAPTAESPVVVSETFLQTLKSLHANQ